MLGRTIRSTDGGRGLRRATAMLVLATGALGATVTVATTRELVEEHDVDRTIDVTAGAPLRVEVRNIFGSVRVTGHDRPTVELRAHETIRADDARAMDEAKQRGLLRVENEDGRVGFVVGGREGDDCCRCDDWDDFVVEYDIEVRVPADAAIEVSTVNDGTIEVTGVRGEFDVTNVNGPVRLDGLTGSGHASTVNGRLTATFAGNPPERSEFETVNGDIDVTFQPGFSADLEFKTFNGEVWTDFDVVPLPPVPVRESTRDGEVFVIRSERRTGVRVAEGGPRHHFQTLNGDIRIHDARR